MAKTLEEPISVSKECDACKIEACDLGGKVRNQKQAISHSSKEHKKCASDVQSLVNTIREENKRLLDKVNIVQKRKVI